MGRPLLLLVVWLGVTPLANAADWKGSGRVWTGLGFDTNPRRDFTSDGVGTPVDGFASILLQGQGTAFFDRARVSGSYDGGARKFFALGTEDTLVQNALVEGAFSLGKYFEPGLQLRGRDRRGAERDYSDLAADAFLDFFPDATIEARATVGAHRFLFWNRFAYSFWAPAFGFSARVRLNKRHSISVFGNVEPRAYNSNTTPSPTDPDPIIGRRRDFFLVAGLSYSFKGPFIAGGSYSYVDSTSNSYGETFRRHRLALSFGFRLPWELSVVGSAAVQLAQFPDGVYLSSELTVIEDDENANSGSLKLVRPISKYFDVDVKYSIYFNRLVRNDFSYLRQVATFGISFHY